MLFNMDENDGLSKFASNTIKCIYPYTNKHAHYYVQFTAISVDWNGGGVKHLLLFLHRSASFET